MVKAKTLVELECSCGQLILKSYSDGTTKLRSKIVLFGNDGKSMAICRACSREVPIPVTLQKARVWKTSIRHYVLEKKST